MKKSFIFIFIILFPSCVFANREAGIIAGRDSGISIKYDITNKNSIDFVFDIIDSKTIIHSDYLIFNYNLFKVNEGKLPLYYGGGIRLIDGENLYIQAKVGIEYLFDTNPLSIFIEFSPAAGKEFSFYGGFGARYRF